MGQRIARSLTKNVNFKFLDRKHICWYENSILRGAYVFIFHPTHPHKNSPFTPSHHILQHTSLFFIFYSSYLIFQSLLFLTQSSKLFNLISQTIFNYSNIITNTISYHILYHLFLSSLLYYIIYIIL